MAWFIAFLVFLLANWMIYALFLRKHHWKLLNVLMGALFLTGIVLTSRLQAFPVWVKYVHVLSITMMYYVFLLFTLLEFPMLDKAYLPKETMIKNIRILALFAFAWLSANTYISYL